ncbi:MAG: hypothetical protein RPU60_12600 [Candidatus Sedimenticola sp. (ex Thyasira tokunagai)]
MNQNNITSKSKELCEKAIKVLRKSGAGGSIALITRNLDDKGNEIDFTKEWGAENLQENIGIEVYAGKHQIRNVFDLVEIREVTL